jgi:hypothetical protein
MDGFTQLVSGQQKACKDAETSRIGDSLHEIRPCNATHAGLEDGIVNAKKITEPGVENRARC